MEASLKDHQQQQITNNNSWQLAKDMLLRLCLSTALYNHDRLAQCQPVLGLLLLSCLGPRTEANLLKDLHA